MSPDGAADPAPAERGRPPAGADAPPAYADPAARLRWTFKHRWDRPLVADATGPGAGTGRATGEDPSYTGRDLLGRVLDASELLAEVSVGPGDVVAARLANGVEVPALLLAAMARRATLAVVDPVRGPDQVRDMLGQARPKALLGDLDAEAVPDGGIDVHLDAAVVRKALGTDRRPSRDALSLLDEMAPEAACLATFTSGSTGRPKGVLHSASNLVASAAAFARPFELGRDRTLLHVLPMAYMAGLLNAFVLPLVEGWRIVLGPRFGVQTVTRFWPIARRHDVDTFWLVPAVPALLMRLDRDPEHAGYGRDRECVGFIGTAPLDPALGRRFTERYEVPLYESYGLSELLFLTTDHPGRDRHDNVGTPLDGVDLRIRDDGEVAAAAPWRLLGHIEDDAGARFDGDHLLTGDLGRLEDDGSLTITGRKKDLIIRGGINIAPRTIEEVVGRMDGVSECAVVGAPDDHLGERTVCFYAPTRGPDRAGTGGGTGDATADGADALHQRAARAVVDALGADHRIDDMVPLEALPRNANGKVDRGALREEAARRDP